MIKFILALLTSAFVSSIATRVYYEAKMQKQHVDNISQTTDACYNSWKRGYILGHTHGQAGHPASQEIPGL